MTLEFKQFFLEGEEEKENVDKMIAKLPKGHQKLLHGYKFRYQKGNTLKGDDGHIGVIFKDKITVAAPWNYGREFTTLHEIGHLVWEYLMTPELKKEWEKVFKAEKKNMEKSDSLDQNAEEIFCMCYACNYAKHKLHTYHNPKWMAFIEKKVPK